MSDQLEILDRNLGLEELPGDASPGSLTDFLYPAPAPRNTWGILKWWESRRLKYNLIVGGFGFASLGALRNDVFQGLGHDIIRDELVASLQQM